MKIKQVKLAQALPGTASNLLEPERFDLKWDGSKLHAKYKSGPSAQKYETFMVFPANIAHIEYYEEETSSSSRPGQVNISNPLGELPVKVTAAAIQDEEKSLSDSKAKAKK
jgi:hypothetical protein